MSRHPQTIHFERIQVYLLPEEVLKIKIEANNKSISTSRYLRNIIINTFTSNQRNSI